MAKVFELLKRVIAFAAMTTCLQCLAFVSFALGNSVTLLPLLVQRWCPYAPIKEFKTEMLDPSWREHAISQSAPIVDMPVVKINLTVPESDCSVHCRNRISQTLAQTLNLWRQVCLRCNEGTMAFVVDEQVVYIDSRVYEALRDASGSLFDRALAASAVLFSLSTAGNTRTGYVIGTYAVVPREAPEVRQFCEAGASPPSGTWIEKLTTALCKSPDMSKNVPSMNVSFVQGPVCENAGFVACGEPDKKVSLSLTKLSYVGEAGTRDFIIGDKAGKAYSLVSVFLHEGGHFLGLPHLPREDLWSESIWTAMLSRVRPETCLSMMETTMLNSAADLGWLNRAKKCEGLLRTETEDK